MNADETLEISFATPSVPKIETRECPRTRIATTGMSLCGVRSHLKTRTALEIVAKAFAFRRAKPQIPLKSDALIPPFLAGRGARGVGPDNFKMASKQGEPRMNKKRSSDDAKLSGLLIGDGRTTARQRSHLSSCRSSSLKSLRSLNWRYTEAKRT